jgi:signal transduction histidine kinase
MTQSAQAGRHDGAAWVLPVTDRVAPHVLAALAFCAPFPALADGSGGALADVPVVGAVPPYLHAAAIGLLAAVAVRMAPSRRWPLFVVAAIDMIGRSSGLVVAVASYVAATTSRPRPLLAYLVAASVIVAVPARGATVASSLGAVPVFVWLPVAVGLWVAARRQVLEGLRERADRLEREQAARADQARATERARIARDMHDVVAHRVSLMVLHAGALMVNATDPRVSAQAEVIRTTGTEALAQLRTVLGVLVGWRDHEADPAAVAMEPQPTLADLGWLLDQSRAAGVQVELEEEGQRPAVPAMVEHAAYRVVQEALTNIHKHAGATVARVVVRYLPTSLEVTVHNARADTAPAPVPGSGLGLIGVRERVEVLGGELSAGPAPDGGFAVSVRLPT